MSGANNFRRLSVLMIAGFATGLIGCVKGGSGASGEHYNVTESSSFVVGPIVHDPLIYPTANPPMCYTDSFTSGSNPTGKADILFVVQTSDSIAPQRAKINSEIQDFIRTLPATADYNIAVMLSHGSYSGLSGRLYRVNSEPVVLKTSELSKGNIQAYMAMKLDQIATDPGSAGGEEGMYSLFNGITTPSLLAESQSNGFFRQDAALGVVFVADRRDICAMVPAGVPAETNPVKIDARIRDCEGLTAAGLTNRLKALKGNQAMEVSGIIYAATPVPAGKEIGYGITEMIARSPGVAIDIKKDDISNGLSSVAQMAGDSSGVQTQFVLTHDKVKKKSVSVRVNGELADFNVDGKVVTIKSPISSGANVQIDYCLKSKFYTLSDVKKAAKASKARNQRKDSSFGYGL